MRSRHLVRIVVCLLLLLSTQSGYGFSQLVIFGDSLSDTGNITGGLNLPFPYYQNRISNGPVAVDVLAQQLGLSARTAGQFSGGSGENYAVSGGNAHGSDPEDLSAQLAAFRLRHPQGLGDSALYLIMIGGNDLRDARRFSASAVRRQLANRAADAVVSAVQSLNALGATTIVVANAPDISRIPETLQLAAANSAVISRARDATIQFNQRLASRIKQLDIALPATVRMFDLSDRFNRILDQPGQFGFNVTDRACFDPRRFRFNPGCDFNRYVFFDSIHPTGRTHQLLGDGLFMLTRSAGRSGAIGGALLLLLE